MWSYNRQSREAPKPNGYPPERLEEILRAYQERSILHGLERTFSVSRNTVTDWLQKRGRFTAVEFHGDPA